MLRETRSVRFLMNSRPANGALYAGIPERDFLECISDRVSSTEI